MWRTQRPGSRTSRPNDALGTGEAGLGRTEPSPAVITCGEWLVLKTLICMNNWPRSLLVRQLTYPALPPWHFLDTMLDTRQVGAVSPCQPRPSRKLGQQEPSSDGNRSCNITRRESWWHNGITDLASRIYSQWSWTVTHKLTGKLAGLLPSKYSPVEGREVPAVSEHLGNQELERKTDVVETQQLQAAGLWSELINRIRPARHKGGVDSSASVLKAVLAQWCSGKSQGSR